MKNFQIRKEAFYKALNHLNNLKILVVGDIILDEYIFGQVERISPEAPVPIVEVKNETITLGGCGNVIKNLSKLNLQSFLISRSGKDEKKHTLIKLLKKQNIIEHFLLESENVATILKTRIIAKNNQLCRIDRENQIPLLNHEELNLYKKFDQMIQNSNAVILSDYAKGLLSKNFIDYIIKQSLKYEVSVFVDPQVDHFFHYKNVTTLTPNHIEIGNALGKKLNSDSSIEEALKKVTNNLNLKFLVVTRGKDGMSLYLPKTDEIFHIPTIAKEVFDVTGAGDTVIAVLSSFLTSGLNILESVLISNVSAGIVVNKFGSATVSFEEIEKALLEQNLLQ